MSGSFRAGCAGAGMAVCRLRQLAEAGALPGRRVRHARRGGRAFRNGDTETLGGRLEQHLLRGRAGDAHAETRAAHRHRAARELRAEPARQPVRAVVDGASQRRRHRVAGERTQQVGVRICVERRRFLDPHQLPVGFHLLGCHHGQRGLRSLTHVAVRHQDGGEIVGRHRDPGGQLSLLGGVVGNQAVAARRQCDARDPQNQPAADERPRADEGAACPLTHGAPPRPCRPWRRREWRGVSARTCRSGRCW